VVVCCPDAAVVGCSIAQDLENRLCGSTRRSQTSQGIALQSQAL
jgi:hypothetical protein